MHRDGDIAGALRWAAEAYNAKTRGRRLTAWQIASGGPSTVDNCSTIEEAAQARGVSHTTIYEHLKILRVQFGLVPPKACLVFTEKNEGRRGHRAPNAPNSIGSGGEVVDLPDQSEESDWNLPMSA